MKVSNNRLKKWHFAFLISFLKNHQIPLQVFFGNCINDKDKRLERFLPMLNTSLFAELINYSFTWDDTYQGRDYWYTIYTSFHDEYNSFLKQYIKLKMNLQKNDKSRKI